MGKNTRLSFRYWIKGSGDLRVQIYSLSNGYHRHLTLRGLPQKSWQACAVDMTAMRRPDGSGGPLAEDERIDDIQFYADPSAELIIDDIVLYDAASPDETEPFPKRVIFTGGFDTGRQGREWPGQFEIVPHEKPEKWKAARSVPHPVEGTPWIRLDLRGDRPLGTGTRLKFRYRANFAPESLKVQIVSRSRKDVETLEASRLNKVPWSTMGFIIDERMDRADEIRFHVPAGCELLVDDVVLYERGNAP